MDFTDSISVGARSLYSQSYDENVPIFDLLPGIQEWAIGANNHPFHLHVYHQQIQGACSGGDFEDGEYYDTISGSCDIRFDTDPTTTTAYDGRTIMHCHILQHEDNGPWAGQMQYWVSRRRPCPRASRSSTHAVVAATRFRKGPLAMRPAETASTMTVTA